MIKRLYRLLPRGVREPLRRVYRRFRSLRYRARERLRPVRVTQSDIENALRELGVGEGDVVFFQAGMAGFGTIEGGPGAVIEALQAVVGEEGLIAMPAFPMGGLTVEYLRSTPVVDLRSAPSAMGAVSEAFRTSPGVLRSAHPSHSVSAWGNGAEELVAGHESAPTPFGAGTPYAKLVERGGTQIFFGTGVRPLTMYHVFECLRAQPTPIQPFLREPIDVTEIAPDGRELHVRTLVHRPELAVGRVDASIAVSGPIERELLDAGMKRVPLGRSNVMAVPLDVMLARFEEMLPKGITMYRREALEEGLAG
jgi:aminoglycoside 3-N-acetyltransferase